MARTVSGVEQDVARIVGSVAQQWVGSDSSRASIRYANDVRPALQSVTQLLADLAGIIDLNVGEQQEASNGGSPGAGLTGGGAYVATVDTWTSHSRSAADVVLDEHGLRAQAEVSGSANIVEGSAHYSSGSAEVNAHGTVGVSGSASASASLGADGLSADVHGEVFDGARGGVDASADLGVAKATGHGEASAGLEASGQGSLHVDGSGVTASAEGKAFLGAEAGVEGSMEVGGVTGTAGAHGMVGIGVEGSAKGSFGPDKVGFSVDAGLAVGLGGSVHIEVSVNPAEVVKNVTKAVSSWFKF